MAITVTPFLRNVLVLDAAVSGAAGVVMAAGAAVLGPLLDLPQPLLFWAGVVLLPWTAFLTILSRRQSIPMLFYIDVVGINALWVAASIGLLAGGYIAPNLLGALFVVAQALAVGLFTGLQVRSWRQTAAA